jgi:6-hydroxytryprostatin B O-methyltransferase
VGYAITNNIFYEPTPDEVAHTTYSSSLVTDKPLRSDLEFQLTEVFRASAHLGDAFEKWPVRDVPNRNAWCFAHKTEQPIAETLNQDEPDEDRIARYVHATRGLPTGEVDSILANYDWSSVKGNVVHVGGSPGTLATALARQYSNLSNLTVLDLPHLMPPEDNRIQQDLKDRVGFEIGAPWSPLPDELPAPKALVLRSILSQYSDKWAKRIIRNFLEPLRAGAVLIVIDVVLPDAESAEADVDSCLKERDLEVLIMYGGKQRNMQEWEQLFHEVDQNLGVKKTNLGEGNAMLEIRW